MAGNQLTRGTWKNLSRRRHVERASAPTSYARLWIAGSVVRHHGIDDDTAVMTRAQLVHRRRRALDLLARRHQRGPVPQRPAVILHVRNLDAARAKREREIDHLGDPVDVGTMHDRIDGEEELVPHDL